MSTDGVKIIDGDRAHDTYWGIMDLYDSGAAADLINKEFPIANPEYIDDFDNEIYVTSCALALWEIGLLTNEKLEYVKSIVGKGACVREWSQDDIKVGIARQKVLNKFFKKISLPNTKIRPPKKYRKITNLHFQVDDVLAFQLNDGNYRAVICAVIDQYRGATNYIITPTTYMSNSKPTIEDILDENILGLRIFSGYPKEETMSQQPGIERIWNYKGGECNFFFGLECIGINHKDFVLFKNKFERIGSLKIKSSLKHFGLYGFESEFERFEQNFSDLEKHIQVFKLEKYPISIVCDY